MEKTISLIRVAVAAILIFALTMTGIPFPGAQSSVPAAGGIDVVYADTTTGGAVDVTGPAITPTGPAVKVPVNISGAKIAKIKDIVYNGKVKKPSPKVTFDGKKLKKNKHYTISYKKNKLPGTATITIKGKKPNYTGTKKITFKIIIPKPAGFKLKTDSDSVNAIWKKTTGKITGYKVYYAQNAKFTKLKKVKTLTSSQVTGYSIDRPYYARSYYVKVRAYKTIGKKNYYSAYTTVKMKKTKNASWFEKASGSIGKDTKWIETDLSKQIVYLHIGRNNIVKTYSVSSGKPGTPTRKGTFRIYRKIALHDMVGEIDPATNEPEYITKDVPWSTYFVQNYAFHGASWNPQVNIPVDGKRVPRSHGCVNMRVKDAAYLYSWAPIGTLVIVHS